MFNPVVKKENVFLVVANSCRFDTIQLYQYLMLLRVVLGCPPTHFGPLCTKLCPGNCSGPCHLKTGHCTYGCLNGWIGNTCEFGMEEFDIFY